MCPADDKEVQEFLNNSVAFKTKIENIQKGEEDQMKNIDIPETIEHNWSNGNILKIIQFSRAAVSGGSLKDLQANLDRYQNDLDPDDSQN